MIYDTYIFHITVCVSNVLMGGVVARIARIVRCQLVS